MRSGRGGAGIEARIALAGLAFVALTTFFAPSVSRADPAPGTNSANYGIIETTSGPSFTVTGTVVACPVGTADDVVCLDNNGVVGGTRTGSTDPDGLLISPQKCAPADSGCTAATLNLFGGQAVTEIAIDGADPAVTCAGDNDTVAFNVIDNTGSITVTTLTEGTEWTATSSVADTCASLATSVGANVVNSAGAVAATATCTSPAVLVTLAPTTGLIALEESTGACTTVSVGAQGTVVVHGDLIVASPKGALASQVFGTEILTFSGGGDASKVTTGSIIPDGAFLTAVSGRVLTAGTTCTGMSIGDGSDVDLWGANIAVTDTTTFNLSDATATFNPVQIAVQEITVTGTDGASTPANCVDLVVALTAHYSTFTAATTD